MTDSLPNVHVRAEVLVQALPHMQRYDEEIVVDQIWRPRHGRPSRRARTSPGTSCCSSNPASSPIVVHGGGPQIGKMLEEARHPVASSTAACASPTQATVEIVEMVLAGSINKQIVGWINAEGGKAIGLCGKDGNMVTARKATRTVVDPDSNIEKVVDLGFVGEPEQGRPHRARHGAAGRELIPVLAPVAVGGRRPDLQRQRRHFRRRHRRRAEGQAPAAPDRRAGRPRQEQGADPGDDGRRHAARLIADGTITGGMIPKVETCIYALEQGVEARGHPRRQGAARGAARAVHRPRRRHADPARLHR